MTLIAGTDIPAHTYQLSFESNPRWSKFYAPAPEICQYWIDVAEKYRIRSVTKFRHDVQEARWNNDLAKWEVLIEDTEAGTVHRHHCDVLLTAIGGLNRWTWPSIPGLHDFKGDLMHSAGWKENFDVTVSLAIRCCLRKSRCLSL